MNQLFLADSCPVWVTVLTSLDGLWLRTCKPNNPFSPSFFCLWCFIAAMVTLNKYAWNSQTEKTFKCSQSSNVPEVRDRLSFTFKMSFCDLYVCTMYFWVRQELLYPWKYTTNHRNQLFFSFTLLPKCNMELLTKNCLISLFEKTYIQNLKTIQMTIIFVIQLAGSMINQLEHLEIKPSEKNNKILS